MKTCWHQLPTFREVGSRLLAMYDAATEVTFNRHGTFLQVATETTDNHVEETRSTDGAADKRLRQSTVLPSGGSTKKNAKKRKRGDTGRRPSKDELVFVERSPDYCGLTSDGGSPSGVRNRTSSAATDGSSAHAGTRGRQCRRNEPTTDGGVVVGSQSLSPESCDVLCCGRGYNAYRETIVERCRCRFIWCCHVACATCEREEDVYVCK
jgi:hypothetical protein